MHYYTDVYTPEQTRSNSTSREAFERTISKRCYLGNQPLFNCLHVLRLTSQMHLIICVTSSDSLSSGHPDNQLKTTEWLSFAPPGS